LDRQQPWSGADGHGDVRLRRAFVRDVRFLCAAIMAAMLRLAFICLVAISIAHAADFPSKPVRFITGAAAGSTGDVLGRVLADQLSTLWKQPGIVDNRPGGGGVIASQATLAAPPDGHTICICAGSYVTITPATTANMPYDVD